MNQYGNSFFRFVDYIYVALVVFFFGFFHIFTVNSPGYSNFHPATCLLLILPSIDRQCVPRVESKAVPHRSTMNGPALSNYDRSPSRAALSHSTPRSPTGWFLDYSVPLHRKHKSFAYPLTRRMER